MLTSIILSRLGLLQHLKLSRGFMHATCTRAPKRTMPATIGSKLRSCSSTIIFMIPLRKMRKRKDRMTCTQGHMRFFSQVAKTINSVREMFSRSPAQIKMQRARQPSLTQLIAAALWPHLNTGCSMARVTGVQHEHTETAAILSAVVIPISLSYLLISFGWQVHEAASENSQKVGSGLGNLFC